MKRKFAVVIILFIFFPKSVSAFQYQSLPRDNLIRNPWFRSSDCKFSALYWNLTDGEAPWGGSIKYQDPTDTNCDGNWTGTAARFARELGSTPEFYPNKNALLSQIVGPVNPENTTLHFHFLFVAHRFNRFKAEIYASNKSTGPWVSVWIPLDVQNCLTYDCANAPYNKFCMDTRTCLWDYVTEAYLGSLNPLTRTISQGYSYYKIEFLGNYPEPDDTATGDVGIKLSRVYFKVSGGVNSSPTPSPTNTPAPLASDLDGDGHVNISDYTILISNFGNTTCGNIADISGDCKVNIFDYNLLLIDYGK